MAKDTVDADNKFSRGQRLEFFLSVLKQMINASGLYMTSAAKSHAPLNKSKAIVWMRDMYFDVMTKGPFKSISQDDFDELAGEYREHLVGFDIQTSFALSKQQTIARDVLLTLLTHNGRGNFDYVFNHGFISVVARSGRTSQERPLVPGEQMQLTALTQLLKTNRAKGMQIIQQMAATPVGPPWAIEGSNLFTKTLSDICHEMIGLLITLPYFECLRDKMKTNELKNEHLRALSSPFVSR